MHGWMDGILPVPESKPEDGQVQSRGEKTKKHNNTKKEKKEKNYNIIRLLFIIS